MKGHPCPDKCLDLLSKHVTQSRDELVFQDRTGLTHIHAHTYPSLNPGLLVRMPAMRFAGISLNLCSGDQIGDVNRRTLGTLPLFLASH